MIALMLMGVIRFTRPSRMDWPGAVCCSCTPDSDVSITSSIYSPLAVTEVTDTTVAFNGGVEGVASAVDRISDIGDVFFPPRFEEKMDPLNRKSNGFGEHEGVAVMWRP